MTSRFTEQEIKDFKESFNTFDLDKDGSISHSELRTLLRVIGEKYHTSSVDNTMLLFDKNNDKRIDIDEFMELADKFIINRIAN